MNRMRIATDVGGTFTDLVGYGFDERGEVARLVTHKVDSTPPAFERGVLEATETVDAKAVRFFAHGSTVVINALLSRQGAKTALITTRGFRDVLEIARGNRPDLFNFAFRKPRPFVPRRLRREIDERTDAEGRVITVPALGGLGPIVKDFREEGVEAIAVCLLHSYANDANERAVGAELRRLWPEVSVALSSEICREWREYERTSTTVLSAFVQPVTSRYLDSLAAGLRAQGLPVKPFMLQSNGGATTVAAAARNPVSMVESGPASGVLGAIELGGALGERDLATIDIGGTTAKCALVPGLEPRLTTDYFLERTATEPGYPIKTPVIEIVEIGSGGGSIAAIDAGGKLQVGPESAGADPGPAVYGRGGDRPTTTDAHVLTGRIAASNLLGGRIAGDAGRARRAFVPLADTLGVTVEALAAGVLRIANADMATALKLVSIDKGYDPRDFTLVAFGGGGALHAVALGEALRFRKVIVPRNPAVFSAWGMLVTDLRRDFVQTRITPVDDTTAPLLGAAFADLERSALEEVGRDSPDVELTCSRYADLRYRGQEHTVKIPFPEDTAAALAGFHEAHERAYTFRLDQAVELVNLHVTVRGALRGTHHPPLAANGSSVPGARVGTRRVDFDEDGHHDAAIYQRAQLPPGAEVPGPAIIEEDASTCVLPPGRLARVDEYGHLHLTLQHGEP